MAVNWNKYREFNGEIDIEHIFKDIYKGHMYCYEYIEAIGFIKQIIEKQPITSRQVAAVVLTLAENIYCKEI